MRYWPDTGEAWLAGLPARVDELCGRWELTLGRPFDNGMCALVAPVQRADGTEAILKVALPDDESRDEIAALRAYAGDGAVQVFDHDAGHHAMLLEPCRPGRPLKQQPDEIVLDVGASLMKRLWRTVAADSPIPRLADITPRWADITAERYDRLRPPMDAALVARGVDLLRSLPTDEPGVLLHADFHPGNILAAEREPWLAIDPKPMVGDPAFEPFQLMLQTGQPDEAEMRRRVAHFADRLELDRDRIAAWGVARCVEWALWDADYDNVADSRRAITQAAWFRDAI